MTTTPPDFGQAGADGRLGEATRALRSQHHPRAVEIANDVLSAALQASRPSLPIRARVTDHRVLVADQVLISRLRQRVDDNVPRCSVGGIYLRVDPDAVLREVTVELYVQYGEVLMQVADQVREQARAELVETLGAPTPVDVVLQHVHISDVTRGDPHLVDPTDEEL